MRGQFPSMPAEAARSSRRERVVAGLAGAALVVPPWLLGAWDLWGQWITLGLAGMAFAALFAPMFDYRGWPPSPAPRETGRQLGRFPIFWLGLAILFYGVLAASNPWLALTGDGTRAWLEVLSYNHWLPRSVESPFWDMNAWRALLVITPAWLVSCAVWAGVGTAGSLYGLIGAVAVNGVLLAGFGLVQHASGAHEMFWVYESRPWYGEATFFSSFIYAGHAGAWLLLAFGAVVACLMRAISKKGRWAAAWGLAGLLVVAALGESSLSLYFSLALFFILSLSWVLNYVRQAPRWRSVWMWLGLGVVVITFRWFSAFWAMGGEEVNPRDPSLAVRYQLARTSLLMIEDEPVWGWGPGSYRFIAPYYLKQNPLFTEPGEPEVLRYRANYAHSDWVQIPVEWGLAGAALFAAALGWWVAKVWRLRRGLPAESWCVLGAVALVLVGAGLDFPLHNAAVLVLLAGLLTAAVKLGEAAIRRPGPA